MVCLVALEIQLVTQLSGQISDISKVQHYWASYRMMRKLAMAPDMRIYCGLRIVVV